MIKLLYFMSLSEVIGCAQEELPLPHDIATVGALLALLGQRGEQYQKAMGDAASCRSPLNKIRGAWLGDHRGDEVAFFPAHH